MRYELFDFQKDAVASLLKKMNSMQTSYQADGSLSAVSLTAPTGAGKTVIAAAVAEGLFYSNDSYPGDDHACILWLSDSPSLNDQTMKRFAEASDMINPATSMETIGPEFALNHEELRPGHIYFLNRQLLGRGKKLSGEKEGNRSFYDVLNNTIEDDDVHLYLFIDEAHRGLGSSGADKGTSDSMNKTIYGIIIDGQDGINAPMPCVVGISATPERFNQAMSGRKRDIKAPVNVPVSAVKASGIIKDTIELRTPKKAADTRHQDLTQACAKLAESSRLWKEYCTQHGIQVVQPLLVVQVEDKVSDDVLESLCSQIRHILPWLDSSCFANVFGEHKDITTKAGRIPYVKPDEVEGKTEIKVLFAKDAVSTGWDCPRAEVIYSRRKRTDPTYIAQLIGRMIRTPLARRIDSVEELNTVACYLPEYDSQTVENVVARLKEDNIASDEGTNVEVNTVDVHFFGETKKQTEQKLEKKQSAASGTSAASDTHVSADTGAFVVRESGVTYGSKDDEFTVNADDFTVNLDDDDTSEADLQDILDRCPKVDSEEIRQSFESIITRQVRHDKPDPFLDLWDCIDVITSDIDSDSDLGTSIEDEFYKNVEADIIKYPAEYKRALGDIRSTTVSVKRVDPLTGEEYEDHDELVENDADRLVSYYRHTVSTFAGASDLVKYYINRRKDEEDATDAEAISRICAVAYSMEIVTDLENWAVQKTKDLLDQYGYNRYLVSEENKEKWDRIEGNTKPYIERTLNIQASVTRQNMNYDRYAKHIISDDNGWAYLNLNPLEKAVVRTELDNPHNVAWYRNQSRNLNASLCIPYEISGELESMYPDFIFFQKTNSGRIVRTIVDPHGDWLGDSVPKLKGYVSYLKDHPDMFGAVLAVTDEKGGTCRYLDLMKPSVQKAIEDFTGSSAKELFNGHLSQPYKVKKEA